MRKLLSFEKQLINLKFNPKTFSSPSSFHLTIRNFTSLLKNQHLIENQINQYYLDHNSTFSIQEKQKVLHQWIQRQTPQILKKNLRANIFSYISKSQIGKQDEFLEFLSRSLNQANLQANSDLQITKYIRSIKFQVLNLLELYHSQHINQIKQNQQPDINDLVERGLLLRSEMMYYLQEQEFNLIQQFIRSNVSKLNIHNINSLAFELSSLKQIRSIDISTVQELLKEFNSRLSSESANMQIVDCLSYIPKISKLIGNNSLVVAQYQNIKDTLVAILIKKPELVDKVLEIQRKYNFTFIEQSKIHIFDTYLQDIQSLKDITQGQVKFYNASSIIKKNLQEHKYMKQQLNQSLHNIFSILSQELLDDKKIESQSLWIFECIQSILTSINTIGFTQKTQSIQNYVHKLFQKFCMSNQFIKLFKQQQGVPDIHQTNFIKRKKNSRNLINFMNQLITSAYYLKIFSLDKRNYFSKATLKIQQIANEFFNICNNKELQTVFQIDLSYLLIAQQNYVSRIWKNFAGILVNVNQVMAYPQTLNKLYFIFEHLNGQTNFNFQFYFGDVYKKLKQNQFRRQSVSLKQGKVVVPQIKEIEEFLQERNVQYYKNYQAKTFVDLYIPKKQIAFYVHQLWGGKEENIEFKVKKALLEQKRIKLVSIKSDGDNSNRLLQLLK